MREFSGEDIKILVSLQLYLCMLYLPSNSSSSKLKGEGLWTVNLRDNTRKDLFLVWFRGKKHAIMSAVYECTGVETKDK